MGGLLVRKAGDLMYWWNLRRVLQAYVSRSSGGSLFL
jgi:hypothetical protein